VAGLKEIRFSEWQGHFNDPEVMGVVGHQAVAKSYDTNPIEMV